MNIYSETTKQREVADYNVYLQLSSLNYTNEAIAEHMSYSKDRLSYLISKYTFRNNLEYKLQEKEGEYFFNGKFYITQSVQNLLTPDEIFEIYTFTQDLVEQHNGIDYLQSFYHKEKRCKLLFIDQLSKPMIESKQFSTNDNHCTLLLVNEY